MNYFFIITAIVFIIYIFYSIKMKSFSAKESMFWVLGTIFILIFAIFPKLLDFFALKLNIAYPPSLLFLIGLLFLLLINFRSTRKIVKQNDKIIELAQKYSILEFELENIIKKGENNDKN